ncbi:hypothetical protein ACM61V_13830 [Sphingomonas sp. TX0543]|uniref:hypothetical protein n=1 Tax=unclassified Sphingomonas TaxID=196159 RepID=UPI0010F7D23B|nr:hypothetical protein [Sphingomonas sp. 3P27F8]
MTNRPRQLRFPYKPAADESLCGALAAACHDSRVRSIKQVLSNGGVRVFDPGQVQVARPQVLDAVATIMKVNAAQLSSHGYTPMTRNMLALADVVVPRKVIELRRRRVGPLSLMKQPHHRAAWLNRLLPYCPESLELLVDACPSCGPLQWRYARGIGNCDHCGALIAPSGSASLAAALADDYRQAANLMSHQEDVGAEAIKALPSCIQRFSRTTLLATLLRAGIVFSSQRSWFAIHKLIEQPPTVVAQVICAGARMLRGWPHSIRTEVSALTDAMADDLVAYDALRNDLRWLTGRTSEGAELFSIALSTLDGRTADVFATGEAPYYTTTQVSRLLNISSRELKHLRDAGVVRYDKLPSEQRTRARYHSKDIDELVNLLRDCMTAGAAGAALDVPVYAVDQIAKAGYIEAVDDPRVHALRGHQVVKQSVEALVDRLRKGALQASPPSTADRLEKVLAAFPGEKPWGAAIGALLRYGARYYLPQGDLAVRRIMVDPAVVSTFQRGRAWYSGSGVGVTHIALRDAAEVLGSSFPEAVAAVNSAGLAIVRYGPGKGVCRDGLRRLAGEMAFVREVAAYTGSHHRAVYSELTRHGVPRVHGGWCRRMLVQLGLVSGSSPPPSPMADAMTTGR